MANKLQFETSPYLLQHAENPVDWYPWGEAAFALAKQTNKPILLSIGYAACHWCHVMAHESFENPAVAALMNDYFVCIKVDREEHPDVDHLYMDALQAMTGSGGWPLNIFLTPDKRPFYGGTYFPPKSLYGRSSWSEIIQAIHKAWKEKPEEIDLQANQLVRHLQQAAIPESATEHTLQESDLQALVSQLLQQSDKQEGGFGQAPKFPASMSLRFLLNYHHQFPNTDFGKQAMQQLRLSVDKMIAGGMYDQIGGGIARYATDSKWLVPHFEKMLYDNALFLELLCDVYLVTQDATYREVIEATLHFCEHELRAEEQPGFYSALDADSEGVEGKFYTWTKKEWDQALPQIHPAIADWWGVTDQGNWEGTNILHRATTVAFICTKYQISEELFAELLQQARAQLMTVRQTRIRPATDDKILLSWNALMNLALQKASIALKRPQILQQAQEHLDWLLSAFLHKEKGLQHVWCKGQLKILAKLDDYAYLIRALIGMAACTGVQRYVHIAVSLLEMVQVKFASPDGTFFYFSSSDQKDIVVRKMELYDGATPSANAIMQQNLQELGLLMERSDWLQQSAQMLAAMQVSIIRYPSSFSYWADRLLLAQGGIRQLVVAGANATEEVAALAQTYRPFVLMIALIQNDTTVPALQHKPVTTQTAYYMCEQFRCAAPVFQRQQAEQMLLATATE